MNSIPDWNRIKPWLKRINPSLMLAPLAPVLFVITANAFTWDALLSKHLHETAAIILVGIALLIFAIRTRLHHGPIYPLLLFLTASLLFREIHLPYTGDAIYICLAITLIWGYRARAQLAPQLQIGPLYPWLTATLFTYFISQAIARRFFRIIPGEDLLHVPLEETTETAAHILLIITSCIGAWSVWQSKESDQKPSAHERQKSGSPYASMDTDSK